MPSSRNEQQRQDAKMPSAGRNNETSNDGETERGSMEHPGVVEGQKEGQNNNKSKNKPENTNRDSSYDEYTDRSSEGRDMPQMSIGLGSSQSSSTVPIKYRKFPCKLYAMLESPEFEPYISWMTHGRSWKIHNNEGIDKYVLPIFFDNQSFNSFIRLVNAWGFRRKTKGGIDRNSYYHEYFLRGKPYLHERMSRLGINKKKPIGTEPDLFSYPPLPELERPLLATTSGNTFQQPPSVAARRIGEAQDFSAAGNINATLSIASSLVNFDTRGLLQPTPAATSSSTAPTSSTSSSTTSARLPTTSQQQQQEDALHPRAPDATRRDDDNGIASIENLHQQILRLLQHSRENTQQQQREVNNLLQGVIQVPETRTIPPACPPARNNNEVIPTGVLRALALATSNTDGSRINGAGGISADASSTAALPFSRELFVELAARELAARQIQESYDQSAAVAATLLASLVQGNSSQSPAALLSSGNGAFTASSMHGLTSQQQQQQQQQLPFASQQSDDTLEALLSQYGSNSTTTTTTNALGAPALQQQNIDQQQLQQLVLLLQQQVTGLATGRGVNNGDNDGVDEGQVHGTGVPRRDHHR